MSVPMNHYQEIACPTCAKQNTWHAENLFKPFCSDRCKLIDLGEWASETRKIPGAEAPLIAINKESDDLMEYII